MCAATSSRTAVLRAALFLIFSICAGVFKSFLEGTISPLSLCSFIFSSIGIWHFLYFLPLPPQSQTMERFEVAE
jgi:predicted RND superfamily exporter protein